MTPRVLLVGLGPTSLSALEGLCADDRLRVVGLVRAGSDPTTVRAGELGVPVLADATVAGVRAALEHVRPDAVAVSSFHRILPADVVGTCPFVNVHYAPLPRLRGRATVNWAIINGEDRAWISVHRLVPALDSGGLLLQEPVSIGPQDTVTQVYEALDEVQRRSLPDALLAALAGDPGREQDPSRATYGCSRLPEDGQIDWTAPTASADRLIRALAPPYPGAFTWLGLRRMHVVQAVPDPPDAALWEGRVPGRVVAVDRAEGTVDVLTGDGVLRLVRLRPEGERHPVPATQVVSSVKATFGLRTSDLVDQVHTLSGQVQILGDQMQTLLTEVGHRRGPRPM
jgi:methionyl-tRNA formyltransferase